MSDTLTDEHHDWASNFCGIDTRGGAGGGLSAQGQSGGGGASGGETSGGGATGAGVDQGGGAATASAGAAQAAGGAADGSGQGGGGAWDSIKGAVSGVADTVEKTVGGAIDGVGKVFDGIGGDIKKQVGDVVKNVEQTVNGVLDDITKTVDGVIKDAGKAVGGVEDRIEKTVGGVLDQASKTVGGVITDVGKTIDGAEAKVRKSVGDAVDSVEKTVGGAVDAVEKKVGELINGKPPTPADPAHEELYRDDTKDKAAGTDSDIHDKITENDIHQGQVGDCFVLSSIGEIAKLKPEVIKKMIQDNGDGSYTVTLHQKDDGVQNLWGLFDSDYKEVKVKVNADLPSASVNNDSGDAADGDKKVMWPLILEKAYAQVNGGYKGIKDGGWAEDVLPQLTGKDASRKGTSDVSLDDLKNAATSGKPMVFNSGDDEDGILEKLGIKEHKKLPFGMHGNHAYMFEGLETGKDGKTYVRLKNPWGFDDPQLIPFDQLDQAVTSVSTGDI